MTEDLYKQKTTVLGVEVAVAWSMSKMANILSTWSKLIMQLKALLLRSKLEESKIADRENAKTSSFCRSSFCGNLDKRHIAEIVLLCRDLLHSIKNYHINKSLYKFNKT